MEPAVLTRKDIVKGLTFGLALISTVITFVLASDLHTLGIDARWAIILGIAQGTITWALTRLPAAWGGLST